MRWAVYSTVIALACALALALGGTSAHAATTAGDSPPKLRGYGKWSPTKRATATARRVWGPAPCGTVTVIRFDGWQYAYAGWAYEDAPSATPPGIPARACVIVINVSEGYRANTTPYRHLCTLMVHEWGHLMGRKHNRRFNPTGIPRSIMNPAYFWQRVHPACRHQTLMK